MSCSKQNCTCHDLSADEFRGAICTGCDSVKACFQYHRCLPKCGKCIPLIRELLAESVSKRTLTTGVSSDARD